MSKKYTSYQERKRRKEQSAHSLCALGMFVMIGLFVFPFALLFADPAPFIVLNGVVIAIASKWIADCMML